jgi:quercetin dioxygenase-like cupin family protein
MNRKWILPILIGVLGAAGFGANALATPANPIDGITTTLTKANFDPIHVKAHTPEANFWRAEVETKGISDVYVVDNVFAPHSDTGWHSHPGPSLILVVQGSVTNYDSDARHCAPHVYTAGQGFVDAGGRDVHILRNETDAAAETMAVQILPTGATRKIDAAQPHNCPSF